MKNSALQAADSVERAKTLLAFHFQDKEGLFEPSFSEPKALPGGQSPRFEVTVNVMKAVYRTRFTYLTGSADVLIGQEILELTAE